MQRNICYLLILFFSLLWSSCDKKETEIGLELEDPSQNLSLKRESINNLYAYTFLEDSLNTKNDSIRSLLGYYKDPLFGKVQTGIYTQVTLSNDQIDLSDYTLDSLIFSLHISGFYPGKSINSSLPASVKLQVYQLDEGLSNDTKYYSTSKVAYKPTALFNENITITYDSVNVDGKNEPPQIRVKLDPAFMNTLQRKFTKNEFIDFVKGLYIRIEPNSISGNGLITYINLKSNNSCISLYHRNASNVKSISRFLMGKESVKFNEFTQDYSNTALDVFTHNRKDSISKEPYLYLQGLGGTCIDMKFPPLEEWKTNHPKAVISDASLILPLSNVNPDEEPPYQLLCLGYSEDGTLGQILDLKGISNFDRFDGHYDPVKKQYRLRITRLIQNITNGSISDWGIRIYIDDSEISANRCIIDGNNLSLEVVYTE